MATERNGVVKVGILTVSDRCSRGEAEDLSGPNLASIVSSSGCAGVRNDEEVVTKCVPDDIDAIQEVLKSWSDELKLYMILTTGGTGFAARDVTPEATRPILDKEAGGVVTAMLLGSLAITPMAMLSRYVCGIRKSTLILNLPGSKKASEECLHIVLPVVPHAMDLLIDNKKKVESLHGAMANSKPLVSSTTQVAITGCKCHHDSAVSTTGAKNVARRARKSPYPMVPLEEALGIVMSHATMKSMPVTTSLHSALGRVLSEDVLSPIALPSFPASIKDGYAVIASDGEGERVVLPPVTAGENASTMEAVTSGRVRRITTGAPLPPGTDAVVQVEDTELVKTTEDGSEEALVRILASVGVGCDVRPVGSDITLHQKLLTKGGVVGPSEVGLLAAVGRMEVQTIPMPSVAVLSTGNEIVDPSESTLNPGQVYDSNRSTLLAILKEQGFPSVDLGIVEDSRRKLVQKLTEAFNSADVVVTSGGVSMGELDLLKPVLMEDFGADVHFGRVFLKPGKPTTFATVKWNNARKLVFALPGNPVSSTVTFYIFVLPALRKISGKKDFSLREVSVRTSWSIKLDPRPEFQRVHVSWDKEEAVFKATSTGKQGSSRLLSMKTANALLVLPPRTDSQSQLPAGASVSALLIPGMF